MAIGIDLDKLDKGEISGSGFVNYPCESNMEEVLSTKLPNNKNYMKSLKGLMSRILDADLQKLYKADYLNGDMALTDEGKSELLNILFVEKKAELVTRAEEKLAEEKDK